MLIAESEEFDANKGIEDKFTSKIDKVRADIIFFIKKPPSNLYKKFYVTYMKYPMI